jgi:hypothetical protein
MADLMGSGCGGKALQFLDQSFLPGLDLPFRHVDIKEIGPVSFRNLDLPSRQDGLGVYEFGAVVDLGAVVPGDVLQFEDTNLKQTNPGGSWYWFSFPHACAA